MSLETAEEFHARVAAATDAEGRLPVAIEAMPGWDIFPFELDGLRIKPLEPLQDVEPPREGEDPADCSCRQPMPPERAAQVAWRNERWLLVALGMKLPVSLILRPRRPLRHRRPAGRHGRRDGPADGGGSPPRSRSCPASGRCHIGRYGDGGAHAHPFFFGRPARMAQLRGSCLLDWEENLPEVPEDVRRANAGHVGRRLVERLGGEGPAWEA